MHQDAHQNLPHQGQIGLSAGRATQVQRPDTPRSSQIVQLAPVVGIYEDMSATTSQTSQIPQQIHEMLLGDASHHMTISASLHPCELELAHVPKRY